MATGTTSGSGIAKRYASAFLDLADDKKQLDKVADDLRGLRDLLRESEDLRRLIRSPLYSREQQSRALEAVLAKGEFSDLTRRFVSVVAANRRLFALPEMIEAYLVELSRRRGEVTAEVTAAQELTKAQRDALSEQLRKAVGNKVDLDLQVDPALIGGLVVRVGSRMIDASLKSKLQRLQIAMKGVG